jgi:hypothetical protein
MRILSATLVVLVLAVTLISEGRANAQKQDDKVNAAIARAHLALLSLDVAIYKIDTNKLPPDLETLTTHKIDGKPLAEKKDLIDPWGRAYKYDVNGPKNGGKQPDIWSEGPDPKDPKGIIGNWEKPK